MNNYTKATVLAALALTAPMVCQAQDPLSSLGQVKKMAAAGQVDEALDLCEKVLKRFSGDGPMAKQFGYVLPFYAFEKGEILRTAKRYEEAFKAYKDFNENKRWRDPALLSAAKTRMKENAAAAQQSNAKAPEAFAPYLTMSLFQMGHCRYLQGVGDAKTPGDPSKLDDAIKYLEQYLDLLKKGKVSRTERDLKLDGRVCFLLVQANLLKSKPDFKTAGRYLDESRKAKGRVPDDLAMAGLGTIVKVATSSPENAGWIYKIIEASPASYRMDPLRAAQHAPKFLNYGVVAASAANKALAANDMKMGADALRSATALLGLVPDVREMQTAIKSNVELLDKYEKPLTDPATGAVYQLARQKKNLSVYDKMSKEHQELEGLAILYSGNTALAMGSSRLGKAGFQILADRYINLSSGVKKGKDGKPLEKDGKPVQNVLTNTIYFQLSQLCYATGDEAGGAKYESKVDGASMGGDQTKSLAFNKLRRILSAQQWAEVPAAAEEVKKQYAEPPSNKFYATAQYAIVAAHYKLAQYDEVIKSGKDLLEGNILVPSDADNGLKVAEVNTYGGQVYYFLMDAYMKKARMAPALYDEAIKVFENFEKRFPSKDLKENAMAAHMHYNMIDALLKKAERTQDEAEQDKLKARALGYCKVITDNWKKSDYYATAELLAASIIVTGKDDSIKPDAIKALERSSAAALEMEKGKGKSTAANALYWLACYGKEIKLEGEDDAAQAKRVQGYIDQFWKSADFEGNHFALQMVSEMLLTVKDKASFDAAVQRARDVIGREATYNHKNNRTEPELEKTINTYVAEYVKGTKTYDNKELTLEEKSQHFNNFPGIQADDKYARAIFRMSQIRAMGEELKAVKGDENAKNKLTNDIQATFREMTREFKPDDLTNFICVQVGNYLVDYVSSFPDPTSRPEEIALAATYFQKVLDRNTDMLADAMLGKANALAFSKDDAKQKEAGELYAKVAASPSAAAGPALVGLTKMHLRTGNAAAAVESAQKYVSNRANAAHRLDMLMMLGEAYAKSGKTTEALQTYMNLYNQNKGNISYSAPACRQIMKLFWERNNPSTGDRMKGDFKASDRWNAWNTGQQYVTQVKRAGLLEKFTPAERDAFNAVENDLNTYKADSAVQREDKANKDFQNKIKQR